VSVVVSMLFAVVAAVQTAPQQQQAAQRDVRQWYQAYSDGKQAIDKKDYVSAVQSLLSAKRSGPPPGRRVLFYRDIFDAFNPDYYLGIAYYSLKQYAEADAAFDAVKNAKLLVQGDKDYANLNTLATRTKFERALGDATTYINRKQISEATAALDRAAAMNIDNQRVTQLRAQVTALTTTPTPSPTGTPTPSPSNTATPTPSNTPTPTTTLVPNLIGLDQGTATAILQRAGLSLGQVTAQESSLPGGRVISQRAQPGVTIAPGSPIDLVVSAIVLRPTTTPSATPTPSPTTTPTPTTTPAGTPTPTPTATPGGRGRPTPTPRPTDVSQALDDGVVAFLSGDYVTASRILESLTAGVTSSPRAALYLASSKVAMRLTGQGTEILVAEARADLQTAGLIDDKGALSNAGVQMLAADLPFISPRIKALLGVKN